MTVETIEPKDRATDRNFFYGSNTDFIDITQEQSEQVLAIREILSQKEINFLSLENMVHTKLGFHDVSSESHCYRTSQNAYESFLQIDRKLSEQLNPDDIKVGGLLHDIGKLCVDKKILTKSAALTPEEVEIIKMHPYFSYKMLFDLEGINRTILNIALYHHERWDGKGYPCGFNGQEIPEEARIFAVIDVWDALISERPYREAMPHSDALKMMMWEKFAGHFDPKILVAFVKSKEYLLTPSELNSFVHKNKI